MRTHALTRQGLGATNEDRVFVDAPHHVVGVLDGESEQGRAADLACEVLATSCARLDRRSGAGLEVALLALVQEVHAAIHASNIGMRRFAGRSMSGTSLTLCSPHEDELVIAHVGDTRLYVSEDARAWTRVTRDHSLREDPLAAAMSGLPHLDGVVTRLLGIGDTVVVDGYRTPLHKRALLCTDGLWRSFDPRANDYGLDIDALMQRHDGEDDATLVLVDWDA